MTCPREMGNPSLSVLWIGTSADAFLDVSWKIRLS